MSDDSGDDELKGLKNGPKKGNVVKSVYNVVSGAKGKKRNQQKDMAKNDFTAKHQEHAKMVVDFEGWMWKKGDTRSNWKRRYFLLSGPFLSYYHDQNAASKASFDSYDGALGVIPLRGVKVERNFHKNRENCFKVVHKERRTYFLDVDTEDEKFAWLDSISKASDMGIKSEQVSKFYLELGLDHNVDWKVIKRTYRKLALKYHPDKGGDVARFQLITEAYEVLSSLQQEVEELEEEAEQFDKQVAHSFIHARAHPFTHALIHMHSPLAQKKPTRIPSGGGLARAERPARSRAGAAPRVQVHRGAPRRDSSRAGGHGAS
jgi:hypothetical protein